MKEAPALFTHWYDTLLWMFERAQRIPKSQRALLTARFLSLGLEMMDTIHALRYTSNRGKLFARADRCLDRTRVTGRLLLDLRILSMAQYERLALDVDEAGRMLGGWKKAWERSRKRLPRNVRPGFQAHEDAGGGA